MILEEFNIWHEEIRGELKRISALLSEPISDEPEELINDLRIIEAWYARCGSLLSEANSWLDSASWELLPEKGNRMEADRRLELEATVSPIRKVRDFIESLSNSIKQRLILGESILSYQKQFFERKPLQEKIF